jgi:hypothetical protein
MIIGKTDLNRYGTAVPIELTKLKITRKNWYLCTLYLNIPIRIEFIWYIFRLLLNVLPDLGNIHTDG